MNPFFLHLAWACPCALGLMLASLACGAQTLTELRLQSISIHAGQDVQALVNFVLHDGVTQCGLRMHWGDGTHQDVEIVQDKDVPLAINHRYDNPGTYQLKAEPKTMLPLLKCIGASQLATLVVTLAPIMPVAR